MAYFPDLVKGAAVMGPNSEYTLPAGEDLSASQYYLVTIDAYWTVKCHDPAADPCMVGVLQNAPLEGEMAVVRVFGFSRAVLADSVGRGDFVMWAFGADKGKVAKFTPGTDGHHHDTGGDPADPTSYDIIVGQTVEAGSAAETPVIRLMFQVL